MIYRIDCDYWGRFFSVPCSVVDEHIRLSDGNFVKVLLCVLCSNSREVDTAELAKQAGVSELIAHDSIIYWTERGVIKAVSKDGREVKQSVPAVNQKATTAIPAQATVKETASEVEAINPVGNSVAAKAHVKYTPKELAEKAEKNEDIKLLINDIQKTLCRTINATEMAGLINLHEYYGFSAASILMIAEYCYQLGKDRFAYIETVAKNWFERGIVSYADIENEIIKQSEIKSYQNRAAKIFGIEDKLSKKQREYIEKWNSMGFNLEMLEIAYEKCMNSKNKLSLNYINGILENWSGKSIKTPQQVEADDVKFSGGTTKKINNKTENKNTSYDLDELEQFALNFNPNNRGEQ